jgi:Holliday junction resolvasome RuvABC endonuclease subunit
MLLALDPSLKATGYCYNDNEKLFYDVLDFSKNDVNQDLFNIMDFLENILLTKQVKYVIREGYAFGFHNNGITRIIEVGGVIKSLCYKYNVPIIDVAPTTIKSIITNTGKATKQDVADVVNIIVDDNIVNDNITDALAIYFIGMGYIKSLQDINDYGKIKIIDKKEKIKEYIKCLVADAVLQKNLKYI